MNRNFCQASGEHGLQLICTSAEAAKHQGARERTTIDRYRHQVDWRGVQRLGDGNCVNVPGVTVSRSSVAATCCVGNMKDVRLPWRVRTLHVTRAAYVE